jgi:hypothetical protein
MDIVESLLRMLAAVAIVATLGTALRRYVFRQPPHWPQSIAIAFGAVSGFAVIEHVGIAGAWGYIALGAWIALLAAMADLWPQRKQDSEA